MQLDNKKNDLIETLINAFDLGFYSPMDFEWLIDKAEAGEWGGLWW